MKNELKQIFLALGADVCGVASIERFDGAEQGFNPKDVYPECRSVIVFGKALPKGAAAAKSRLIYGKFNGMLPDMLDVIAYEAAMQLEKRFDCTAVPMPSDAPVDYWKKDTLTAKGLISMKFAAVQAGLGQMGKNTILLNPEYGNRLSVGAVLTDLRLEPDPFAESICIPGCTKCIDNCPAHAISEGHVNQTLCRPIAYGKNDRELDVVNCNKCRMGCPMRFGKKQ